MSHRELRARAQAAEQCLQAHLDGAATQAQAIGATARQAVTPVRILVAGFVAGALSGWVRPARAAASASRVLRLLRATPVLYATLAPWLDMVRTLVPESRPHDDGKASTRPQ